MYCIGLTGTIASGKSTAAQIFTKFGAQFISADQIAREITSNDKIVIEKIYNKFGDKILDNNGNIKRQQLREIIFANPKARIWLETILHPLIRKNIEKMVNNTTNKFCIIEIPLLKNRELFPYLNHILLITAPQEIQIQRLIERDKSNRDQALQILSNQPSIQEYKNIADTIINNDGNITDLQIKICEFLKQSVQI